MKKAPLAILLLICFGMSLQALSITNNQLELTLHESSGRFTLYAILKDGSKQPLIVEEDPRTTILTILSGSKIYRMGDSFEFRQAVLGEGNSASITWSSASLNISERFALQGATLAITIEIENVSEQDLKIGIRYLLDTYLGEKGTHFTADGLPVKVETDYVWATPYEIISSDAKSSQLLISTTGAGVTEPDRIVLANWKRLNDATWNFEANQTRDFSLLPYSINDSAVALYYEAQAVPSKTKRAVTLSMKWEDPNAVVPSSRSTAGGSASGSSAEGDKTSEEIKSEIIKIDFLIIRIDSLLSSDTPPSDADVGDITTSLDELEKRKTDITEQQ